MTGRYEWTTRRPDPEDEGDWGGSSPTRPPGLVHSTTLRGCPPVPHLSLAAPAPLRLPDGSAALLRGVVTRVRAACGADLHLVDFGHGWFVRPFVAGAVYVVWGDAQTEQAVVVVGSLPHGGREVAAALMDAQETLRASPRRRWIATA